VAVGFTFSFIKLGAAPVIPALELPAATPGETAAGVVAELTVFPAAFFRFLTLLEIFATFAAVPEPMFVTAPVVLLATFFTLFVAVLAAFVSAPVIDEKSPPIPEFDAGAVAFAAIYYRSEKYAVQLYELTASITKI
jgi:hypothetical protein